MREKILQRVQRPADLAARASGQPIAYLVGEREFHGLMLHVTPAVLVPRPDTEVLVDWAIECLQGPLAGLPAPRVVDLGTGSGAIALAVAQACPQARVCGVDLSAAAIEVARANGCRLGLTVEWLHGDWFTPLAGRRFDLVLSNPPYIDGGDPHLQALHAEPIEALSPGPDGLAALAQIAACAPAHLATHGWLLLEHGHRQGDAVRRLLRDAGGWDPSTRLDLAGHATAQTQREALRERIKQQVAQHQTFTSLSLLIQTVKVCPATVLPQITC
jgi:release factor glutamine methyltransferase